MQEAESQAGPSGLAPASSPAEEPPQSPLVDYGGRLLDLAVEASELAAGSGALADAFEPQEPSSDSEAEQLLLDEYEQLDFGSLLEGDLDLKAEVRQFLQKRLEASLRLHPAQILLRDKLTFVLGTLDLWLSAYWLGRSPQSFYKLYTAKAAVLFAARWVTYRLKRWHYYLLDFCYYAQALLLIQLWVYPASITLAKVAFAFNLGPLLWSIIAFRNSLVYHSVDKLTSHMLHWFPACVSWATRWHPGPAMAARLQASPEDRARWERGELWELALLPLLPYLFWAVMYYIKVFVVSSAKIQQRGYDTLYKFTTRSRGSLFGAVVLRFPQKLQPVVYMCMHVLLSLVAMLFNALWWTNYTACTAFLLAVFTVSAWNGASFYFDHFAHRYVAGLGLERRRPGAGKRRDGAGGASESHDQQDTAGTASTARRKAD